MQELIRNVLALKGREVAKVAQAETVLAAVEQMNQRRIGAVVVVVEHSPGARPVGIFTERDVLVRVVGERRDAATVRVGEVMTRALLTIDLNTSVEEAMAIMTARRCRHLPVVDGDRVVGLISAGDLTRWVIRNQERAIIDLTDYIHHA